MEGQNRLQKDVLGAHEALAHGAKGCLSKVPALRVLFARLSAKERDLHVRELGAREDPSVGLLGQVLEDQVLPVGVQHVREAPVLDDNAASGLSGGEEHMDLRVVAQGLKVPDALHRAPDRLPVDDAAGAELRPDPVPILQKVLQDLRLDLSSHPGRRGASAPPLRGP